MPADAVQVLVLGAEAIRAGGLVGGHGDSQGGEAEEDSGQRELHCDGRIKDEVFGIEDREVEREEEGSVC